MYRRRILNRRPVRGFSRFDLNESLSVNNPNDVNQLVDTLKSFMKRNNITDVSEMKSLISEATKLFLKNVRNSVNIGTTLTDDQKNELIEYIDHQFDLTINGSDDSYYWNYKDLIFNSNGECNEFSLGDGWDDGWLAEEFDPNGKFDSFDDWWSSLSAKKKKDIISFANEYVFNYFNGNTDISSDTY